MAFAKVYTGAVRAFWMGLLCITRKWHLTLGQAANWERACLNNWTFRRNCNAINSWPSEFCWVQSLLLASLLDDCLAYWRLCPEKTIAKPSQGKKSFFAHYTICAKKSKKRNRHETFSWWSNLRHTKICLNNKAFKWLKAMKWITFNLIWQ